MITSIFRQIVNCWLAYTLSQPVDVDVPVVLYFIRLYLGLPLVEYFLQKMKFQFVTSWTNDASKKTIEELIPQESYS
jgi:hypothetical protein